ncbi:MAG: response regulator [Anaerolineae bacterium]|jgi:two-component system cell cycle response regulator DivK
MSDNHILYIEDNPGNRMLVRRILEAEGYEITEATDGPAGLEIAAREQFALILLDINLPEIDGYDLAKRMRSMSNLDDVPILAVTANVMHGDKERTLEAGCDGFIPKPIDVDKLPELVKMALEKGRISRG